MQETQLGSIEHLDFDVVEEEKKKPKEVHYAHPTDGTKYWCGKQKSPGSPKYPNGSSSSREITCADCLREFIRTGGDRNGNDWWWRVHRAWYDSDCNKGRHNCS